MKGCETFNLVSKPIFSALARASSVVPTFKHSSLNLLYRLLLENFLQIG